MSDVHSTGALRQQPEAVDQDSLTYDLRLVTTRGEKPWKWFSAGCLKDACERHIHEWARREFASPIVLVAPDGLRYSYEASMYITLARSSQTASGSHQEARSDEQGEST